MKNLYSYSRMMRAGALLCLLLAGAWQGSAQTWTNVGTAGFSGGLVNYTDIAIDGSGNQYVVYADAANSNKATVMTNSGSWTTVGSAGFSAGTVGYTSIAIDSMSMTPYVVYRDNANSGKATVMMYNGGAWVVVGSAGFSAGTVDYTSIAIDGTGTPYVIYRDAANSSKATVMSYNGSAWVVVGSAGFSAGSVDYTSIAIDGSGTPYVVYMDAGNSFYATVMSYNGSAWVTVGSAGFSAGIALHTSIDIDGTGTPYVVYSDDANSSKATVMSYNGSAWVVVGSAGFSAGLVTYTDIAIDGSGTPYVVYRDNANSSKATVMKYNGSAWVGVGSAGFSAGQAFYASIAIHGNGDPYVVYQDQGTLNRATVMYFPPNAAPTFVNGSPQGFSVCQNAAATAINSLLAVSDADAGQTLTWTVTTPPTNGSLSGVASYTATSTGGTVTPTGMTYTPTASYSGTDVFVIQVSDGVATATTTVNVTVKGAPTITTVSPMLGFPASSVTITGTGFDATATNNIVYFGATRATVTGGTTTSLTVTVPTGATFERVTVNNSVTCGLMAASQYPYLPYYDNSAYVASTVNVDLSISLTSAGIAYHTAIGDIDGDGKADIVTANITTGNVSVFRNTNTSGSLLSGSFSRTDYGVGTGPFSVALGDVDGDGKLDVVASNQTSGNATVLRNTSTSGSVSFAGGVNFSLGSAPQFCTIADINDDGKPEIISANNVSNDISVLKNQCTPGSVSFAAMVTFTTSARPAGLGTGDIDGDGKTDVVVACYNSNIISVLRNTSSGGGISFAAKVDFTGNTNPYTIGIGDVDGDGKVDIAVSNNNASGTISLFRNTSTVGSITLAGIVNFTSGSLPGELDMGDIDGDGKVDIAVANVTSGTVSVFRNTASSGSITSASLAAKVDFPAIASSRTMAVGDLDGDGKADLVCGSSTSTINVFRNNPLQAITGTATVCVGSTTTLSNGTAGGTWSSSNPAVGSISSLGVVTGVSGGTITITYAGTAASGPVLGNYTTYAVTVNALPTVSAGSNVTICAGDNTTLTASGATTYTWAPNTNLSATTGVSVTASPTVTVIYTVTGTDANTCVNTATVQVSVNALPAAISGGGGTVGNIVLVAGTGGSGSTGDGGAATAALFASPLSAKSDASGNVYIADRSNRRIRRVDAITGIITTIAGTGTPGFTGDGGAATSALVNDVWDIAFDASGNIYLADGGSNSIRKINTSGIISTYAGISGSGGFSGDGGAATSAQLNLPYGIAFDAAGNLYIGEWGNNRVRKVNTSGVISTIAGGASFGSSGDGGAATAALLNQPSRICVSQSGEIYIMDNGNFRVRKINGSGIISRVAGTTSGFSGDGGPATAAQLNNPWGLEIDASDNLYIADFSNERVRKVAATTQIITTIAGNSTGSNTGNGGPATASTVWAPVGLGIDNSGNLLVTSYYGNAIRKIFLSTASNSSVCTGSSITLTDATSGGTWSSNNANVSLAGTATTTVTVTGVTAGTSILSYTLPTGCYTTATITINQTPTAITGTLLVNVTQTTTLNSTPSGGAWSSSNANATVNSTSGVVTGITAGTTNITYTMPSGCYATATVTVNNYNNGLDFDGSSDYAVIASRPSLGLSSGSMTIEFWAKPTIVDGSFHWVVAKDNTNSSVDYLIGLNSSNNWRFIIRNLAVDVTGATTVVAGTWYHVAGVYNGTTATLYVNGVSDGTAASAGSAVINGEQVLIGARNFGGPTQFFGGTVDEVRIWNVARSSGQITANMTCDVAQDANLVAYYRFDQGTASGTNTGLTCAYDYSGNSNSGTLTSMALSGSSSNYVLGHVPGCNAITLPSPGTFSGNAPVCVASTITLSNANPNGVWTSLATGIATVGSLTGLVTGVTSGTVTVNYTLNCVTSSVVVTVNPLPTITGNTTLSTAITTLLSATPSGGTWVSVSTGVATIGASSGIVTGVSVGTSVISYTSPAGCVSTTTVNVLSPTPGLSCDGTDDYVNVPTSVATGLTQFTVEAWVKVNVNTGTWEAILSSSGFEFMHFQTGPSGNVSVYTNAGPVNLPIIPTTPLGVWRHMAISCQSGATRLFIDGVQLGSTNTATFATINAPTSLSIGRGFGNTRFLSGVVDEMRIWNVARTQSQIQADMNCDVPQNANLLAYYRFNEGVASGTNTGIVNAYDYSGNGNCGALNNFAKTGGSSNYVTGAVGNCNTITIITPAAITGNTPVCVSSTRNLANANTGGVWTSGNAGTATVNSTSGVVTGVAGGTATITYTLNCGIATTVVTVNALPVPTFTTSPATMLCVGNVVTYTTQSGQSNYIWSVPGTGGVDYSIASGGIGTSNNTVTLKWLTVGVKTVTVNYTDANGCTGASPATHTATVNPNPTTPTGTSSICVGQTTTFSSTPSGGTWTSSAPAIATIGSASGIINGVSAGLSFITYTLSTGCYAVRAVFVNPLPTLAPTNTSPLCVGGLVNFTSGGSGSGISYAWSGPSSYTAAVSNPGRSSVALAHAGTYTVTATITATGCSSTATTVVTINPAPTTTPTNTSPVCIGGTVNFNAVATATGTLSYSWTGPSGFSSASPTPSRSSVTSAHAGAYVIAVSTPGSGCNATAVTVVTINAIPAAAPTNSSPVCAGTMVTLSANPVSGTGVTGYSWSGPGGFTSTLANPTVTPTTTTTYSLTVTSGGASGCSPSTVYTTIVTVNPMPAPIAGGGSGTTSNTFNYTGSIQNFTVPAGVTSVTIQSWGASGANANDRLPSNATGGNGSFASGTLSVTPGQVLQVLVGGAGSNTGAGGFNGGGAGGSASAGTSCSGGFSGGGGGASDVRIGAFGLSDRIIVAAGGGGSGRDYCNGTCQPCGCGGSGGHGDINGVPAGNCGFSFAGSGINFGAKGLLVSTSNGGPGDGTGLSGSAGTLGVGGNGASGARDISGGGGGGGYYGGGGGGGAANGSGVGGGGGGGGSSYTGGVTAGSIVTNSNTGDGLVTISYSLPSSSGAICVGNTTTLSTTPAGGTWTSGGTGVATVAPSTGVVTGVAGGTATITYTLPAGCYTTAVVTVNPLPAAIGGTAVMCAGASTALTNTVSGGTWSSSNTGIATVGSTTGIVSGVAAGNATITYTLPTGCFAVKTVTVNTTPGTITGTMSACVGATTTLSSSPTGGTWSSSNTGTATVSGSGVVSGVAAGTVNITYMLAAGCYTTASVTINPNPASITGIMSVCAGSTTALSSASTGGTWSSSMPSVATVGASSGIVTGAIPGTTVITYLLPTGCITTATVTVNTMPTAIASVAPICVGSTTTLSSTPGGGTWSSSNTAMATVSGSGVVSGLSAGNPVITYAIGSCYVTSIVTINPNPAAITGTMVLCMGSSTSLTSATSGGTWTSSATGVATIGSTSGLLAGVSGGTATITYMMGTGCYTTATVTINTTPSAITGTITYCAGTTGTLTATPSGGTWSSSNTAMATVSGSGAVNAISAGTPVITYSFGTSCMSIVTLTINPNPAAITGTTTVCAGSITTLASTSTGGTWSSSMPSVATVGSTTGIVTGSIAGTTTITYTLPTGCYTTTNVTVNALPVIATWPGTICVSSTATLTATPAGGTWTSSNTGIATIGAGSGIATGVSAGTAMLTYTSGAGCSSATAVTVNGLPTITTWSGALCVSSTTTLNATPSGGTWSSSMPSVATIGATTGVLSGSIAGTTTIMYTLPTGCIATSVATINPLPTAITGIMPICVGGNTTLASTPSGGMWSSSNTGVATVGSTSGIAVGVSAGTAVMTYTVSTGCIMTAVLTINPLPAAITGITNVCTGFTTALFSASTGGTWSSSNTTLATIGSTTGVVTGHVAGTLTITYTLPTGCLTTTSFTVNPTPAPVSGILDVCVGLTTTLSTTPTGGTWTSSNPAEATIGGSTGLVTGLLAGMPVMTYTLPTGCRVMAVVTVNPLPAAISGASSVCTGAVTTLSSATTGGTWSSSSTGTASVGASTGIVTGVTAGTVTITYMLPTGCIATKAMTVNATPTAITGTLTVCTGYTTALASSPTGGTWSSSNPAAGSVSSTGIVTGITAGMPVITYTLATGCYITTAITVNQTPPASTGSNQVCIGSTSTLANTLAGGTWSSSNPTIASVTSTGIVSGLTAGTLDITYTMPTGCFIVTPMTVNALPSSISGPGTVCPGATITLSSTPTGGTWTSSNTMIATVGSTSGIVTGVAGGNVTISYTLATGCRMTALITVNPAPNLSSFSLPTATSPCVGNSSLVTLNSGSIGSGTYTVTYDLAGANASTGNTATVVFSSSTGSFTIPSSSLTLTGAQTAIITSITNSFGCSTILTTGNVASFAVNVLPTVFTVSGGGGYCAGGAGLHIYLSGSTVGVNYQLYNGASPVGGFVAGTSTGLDFGVFTTAGTYTVVATNVTTGCVSNMTGSATITINPLPTAFLVTGGGSYCAGGTGVLVGLAGSQTGVNYQLYNGSSTVGSPVSGTGGTISFGLQTGGGTYTVVATDATTMCVSTMSGSVTVVVNPLPTAFTGPTAICQGSTTTLGSTPSGGTWTSGATSIATVASTSGFVTGVSGGVVTITYTLPTSCMMTGVLTVNPLPAAITGASSVCTGSSTPLASTTSGGTWTSSNTAFATIGSTSGSVTGVMAGTVNITYTLGTGCYVIKPMTINATPAAISGSSTVCTGTTTILTSATTGGTWSSSASQAAVGATTGVVSGVSAGTATITYTLPSGCFVTFPMTVNATPAAIGGTMNVCAGATRTLTNTTSGGTWSTSNVTLATVGSTSGIVSGLAAGTVIISYTMPTGCFTTTSFTVNPAPAAITGLNNVCLGSTIALSNTTSGGTWSSSASGTASVTSTGIVSGAATGTATITYTISGGCFSIYPVTVNPNPATITGTANVCVAASTTLSNATAGGTWTSGNPTIASIGGATGIVTGLAAGTPTISYTLPTGCFAIRVVTVNPNPAAIAGPTNVCTGQAITLTNATTGGTWSSSNTALGTVNPTSGVVTGIAVGTPIISYSLGTGCFATYAVVVNQTPSAITGPSFVCVGSTVTLSNAYGGGTWSSSNTTLATVGASTGLVSGLATGMPVITYSLPPGCITTMVISVNPTPAMITGTMTVCVGSTTILSNATGGGIWSSGNPGVATITGSTGMVSGISAGTSNITYTLPGGCTAVATVTVNPLPAPIAGTDNVCEGLSTTLTNTSGGGTWASSNTLVATVGSASGVVTGLSAGTITITYTLPTSCFITMPFTVNPLPASITGTAVVCVNATTTLSDATTGGLWSSSSPAIATIGSASGVVTGMAGGNTIVTYTLPTGCIATRIVTVNPLPTIYAVTGGGGFCTGGTGVVVGLSGSNAGINYQLYNGGTPTGSLVAGTGASLSFGLITVAGTYTVKATNAVTGCFVNMSGTATVYGIPLPIQYTVTGGGSYCAGGSGFAVGLASSQPGVSYRLYNGATIMGAPLLGTGASISFGTQTLAGTYTVVATNTSGCVSGMLGSVNIIVNPLPAVFTVTGGGAYCSGGSGAVVGLSGSATGINYQLYRGITLITTVAGTGSSISFGAMTVAGTYNVVAVNASTGCIRNMSGSVSVTVSSLPVSTYTVGGGGAFCFGSAGVNVTLSNSDAGINYQLLLGGSPIGSPMSGIGSSLNFGPQTTAGTYTIRATSTSTGCVATMTGGVSVTVNPLPVVQFITGGGSYCAGGTGPAIGISGSQSGVSYRLIRDGATLVTTVAGTGSAFSFGAQSVAGTYTIVAVNATTTCSVNMSGSTVISINPLPTAFTVTGGGGYCIGGSGVAVMLSGSQTGVNYQLFLGSTAVGSPVAGTGAAISFGNQTTGGTYTVVATIAGTGCVATMSGSVAVTVNPLPTAYAVTGGGVYCTGGSGVVVGVANSQTNVNYQLFLGTSPIGSAVAGTTGSAISFGLQTTTGTYTVVATNAITGCVNNMTGSVTISVTSLPSMYLVTGGGSYCIGGAGVAIGLSGSQTGVSYRLYNGTTPVGSAISGTGGILSFGLQTAAGTYTVVATATSSCSSNMLGSVVVNINSLPTLFTVIGGGSYCTGGTGVSVGLSSSLSGTSYQLFRGTTPVGTPVSGTGLALNFGLMTVTGTYTVFATDLTTGCTQTMTGSATVATSPLPTTYTVSGGGSYCSGGTGVAVGLGGSQSGVRYQLYRGSTAVGSPVAGTGSTISFGMQTTAGAYSVIATDTGTFCTRNMTGSVTVAVSALPNIYTMTGGGGFCTGGTGVAIGLTGSQAGVTYRLYLGGSTPIGSAISGTGAAISFGTHTLGGTYTVVASSTASACTSNMSGSAVITVNPLPTIFAVTGGGGYCSGGSGAGIGLANSTVGVNYQLYRGTTAVGAPVAGTGSPLNFGLFTTTGTYTVFGVTAATGCSRNMSGSAVVSVSSLPTAFSVTGGGSYCSGGAGVVVALSGSNTGVSYQLFRGTTAVGSPVAGTGTAINFGLQTVAGTYTVMAVNTTTSCGRNMTGSATVVVNAAPAAFTMTGGGSYCTGSTGLAIGLSGSTSGITYRLYRGTTLVATLSGTGSTLSFGTFTTAGTYTVIATGSTTCTTTMTGSAVITVNALPTAFTVTGGGSYCAGGSGLSIGLSGSTSGVSYQLMRGTTTVGSPMAGTGSALSFGLQTIAGTYTVVAVNATTGCSRGMTGSATISIIAAPTVYTVTGGGAYCSGPGHNIYLSGSQTGVSYQLYLGFAAVGSPVSGTGSAINFGTFTTVGTYTVRATTGSSSCTMMMSGSASITSGSLPNLYSVTGGGSLCAGGTGYAVGLSGSQTGVNYQLYRGTSTVGSPVAGTGGALSFGTMTTAGGYTVVATNPTTGCIRSMSGSATIVVNALPTTFTVTGGGAYCSGGTGVTIGLSGSTTGISYKLYRGTVLVATVSGTGSTISFGLHTTSGTYTVVATNASTGCTSNMTGSATVSVNTTPTISGSIYTVAPAGSITLSGSPSGGVWSSSATSVATVGSSSGVVSGVSLGTTIISYTMSTGCRATRTVSVTPTGHRESAPESATGIVATNNNNSNIYVVPNPNKGVFTVKGTLSTLDEVEVTIELTNMLGQVMYTGKVLVHNGELSEVVRLSNNVANGMYLLNVNSPADSRVIHIVVEQ